MAKKPSEVSSIFIIDGEPTAVHVGAGGTGVCEIVKVKILNTFVDTGDNTLLYSVRTSNVATTYLQAGDIKVSKVRDEFEFAVDDTLCLFLSSKHGCVITCYIEQQEASSSSPIVYPELLSVYKTADQGVTSLTSMVGDTELFVDVETNSYYELSAAFIVGGNTAGDFKYQFERSGLSDAVLRAANDRVNAGINLGFGVATATIQAAGTTESALVIVNAYGSLVTGSDPGTLRLVWAQAVSNATATSVKKGSFILLTKLN